MKNITASEDPGFAKLKKSVELGKKIEKQLGEDLITAFDENATILGWLRGYIMKARDQILRLCALRGGSIVFWKAYSNDAKTKYTWVKETPELMKGFEHFKSFLKKDSNINSLSSSRCSDLIRFFGEIAEAAAAFPAVQAEFLQERLEQGTISVQKATELMESMEESHEIHRQGLMLDAQRRSFQRPVGLSHHNEHGTVYGVKPDERHWQKKKTEKTPDPRRLRELAKRMTPERRQEFLDGLGATQLALIAMNGGIGAWKQLDSDLVNKLNKVFGLSLGATISGTTTDTLFFFDQVTASTEYLKRALPLRDRSSDEMHPLLYMLPLATIVGNAHHTMIEVALPLNLYLKGRFGYVAGRYTTLKPKGVTTNWGKVDETLSAAEAKAAIRSLLVYYEPGTKNVEGYVKFEPKDMSIWNDIARCDSRMVSRFENFQDYPTKRDIGTMHLELSHLLFAGPQDPIFGTTVASRTAAWERRSN